MANCTSVTLLLGHFDRKMNNCVKRVDIFKVLAVENLENTNLSLQKPSILITSKIISKGIGSKEYPLAVC